MSKQMPQIDKSYCKVCFDAGKSEAEYLSHYVKSEAGGKGNVVCPTLLEMSCTYCHTKGHMKSYCVVLNKNVQDRKRNSSRAAYSAKSSSSSSKSNASSQKSNVFDALECASDSETENEVAEDFPALCQVKRVCQEKRVSQVKRVSEEKDNVCAKKSSYATMVQCAPVVDAVAEKKKLSWVEMNEIDSDDDDEDW